MKELLTIVAGVSVLSAAAQGTINFANFVQGVNAPVYLSDGTTKLTGPNFMAQLMAGPTAGSIQLVGSPVGFLTGSGAGYFNGGAVVVPGVAGGATAYVVVVAWDTTLGGMTTGATADQAYQYEMAGHANVWAASNWDPFTGFHPFAVTTGDPSATPPTSPGNLVGLTSFALAWVPEPSMPTLALLGAVLAFLRKRARSCGPARPK